MKVTLYGLYRSIKGDLLWEFVHTITEVAKPPPYVILKSESQKNTRCNSVSDRNAVPRVRDGNWEGLVGMAV